MSKQASGQSTDNILLMKIKVSDVSGQRVAEVPEVPADSTVGELIAGLLPQMRLPEHDALGRDLVYHARLEREGRHLHASEVVGDAVRPGDRLTLLPNIDAGAPSTSPSAAWPTAGC